MRKSSWRAVAGILFLAWPALAVASIRGNYIETRSADVYTGPCFANGEMGIAGQEATLVWQIDKGDFNGVDLDGLSVVSVVKASATLGDPFAQPLPARAVMIVDRQASPEQKAGLVAFARAMGGDLMENVVRTETAPIRIELHHDQEGHIERAIVQVSDLVRIEIRTTDDSDSPSLRHRSGQLNTVVDQRHPTKRHRMLNTQNLTHGCTQHSNSLAGQTITRAISAVMCGV